MTLWAIRFVIRSPILLRCTLAATLVVAIAFGLTPPAHGQSDISCQHDSDYFALGSDGNVLDELRRSDSLDRDRVEYIVEEGLACNAIVPLFYSSSFLLYQQNTSDQGLGHTILTFLSVRGSSDALRQLGAFMLPYAPIDGLAMLYASIRCENRDPFHSSFASDPEAEGRSNDEIRDDFIAYAEENMSDSQVDQARAYAIDMFLSFCAERVFPLE